MVSGKKDIANVADAISGAILEFAEVRLSDPKNPFFHMKDLNDHVRQHHMVAPDSPGRILRMLKQKGAVDYFVFSRSQSLYRFRPLKDYALQLIAERGSNGRS